MRVLIGMVFKGIYALLEHLGYEAEAKPPSKPPTLVKPEGVSREDLEFLGSLFFHSKDYSRLFNLGMDLVILEFIHEPGRRAVSIFLGGVLERLDRAGEFSDAYELFPGRGKKFIRGLTILNLLWTDILAAYVHAHPEGTPGSYMFYLANRYGRHVNPELSHPLSLSRLISRALNHMSLRERASFISRVSRLASRAMLALDVEALVELDELVEGLSEYEARLHGTYLLVSPGDLRLVAEALLDYEEPVLSIDPGTNRYYRRLWAEGKSVASDPEELEARLGEYEEYLRERLRGLLEELKSLEQARPRVGEAVAATSPSIAWNVGALRRALARAANTVKDPLRRAVLRRVMEVLEGLRDEATSIPAHRVVEVMELLDGLCRMYSTLQVSEDLEYLFSVLVTREYPSREELERGLTALRRGEVPVGVPASLRKILGLFQNAAEHTGDLLPYALESASIMLRRYLEEADVNTLRMINEDLLKAMSLHAMAREMLRERIKEGRVLVKDVAEALRYTMPGGCLPPSAC